jgi:hypothetical protein
MAADAAGKSAAPRDRRPPPGRRIVLLGASNLTRGISTVVETSAQHWGRPLDVLAALGHGRSYGMTSSVLGRTLPGILQSGLWPALERREALETAALITDVGNDLFYGAPVERIAGWVEQCLDRLMDCEARIVVTRLPICNLPRVRRWQYLIVRSLFFPSCRLSLDELSERAVELDERLCELAHQRNCALAEPRSDWYGFDPIHFKLRHWSCAWHEMLAPWSETEVGAARASLARWIYLRRCAPELRTRFGIAQRRAQPAARLADGTLISLF